MARFYVNGTIEYTFHGYVEAETEDEAEREAMSAAQDGMFMGSYDAGAPDIWDITEEEE